MYLRVSSFRRFAIYFIDIGLITLVASFILIGVLKLFNFDTARYNALYDSILKNYADFITSGSSKISSQEAMNEIYEFLKLYMIREAYRAGISFILIIGYLVILPYFTKWQTLGRLITRSIVINDNGEIKPTFGKLLVRELVGTFILYILFGGLIGLISAIIAIVTERSLVDRISRTVMVLDTPIPVQNREEFRGDFFQNKEEENFYNNNVNYNYEEPKYDDYKEENPDVIDAEVHEIKEEDKPQDDDDDEYKVI